MFTEKMNVKNLAILALATLTFSGVALALPDSEGQPSYSDWDSYTHRFHAVEELTSWGWLAGNPDGTFHGTEPLNRAELAKLVTVANGMTWEQVVDCGHSAAAGLDFGFSDVPSGEWYEPYVTCGVGQGWITGDDDLDGDGWRTYRPADDVNIAEGMVLLTRAMHTELPVENELWYAPYMRFLGKRGILEFNEADGGDFAYSQYDMGSMLFGYVYEPLTRANAAELMYRLSFEDHVFDPIEELGSLDAFATQSVDQGEYGYYDLHSERYDFTITNLPLGEHSTNDLRVLIQNPHADYMGYETTFYLLYPTSEATSPYALDDPTGYWVNGGPLLDAYAAVFRLDIDANGAEEPTCMFMAVPDDLMDLRQQICGEDQTLLESVDIVPYSGAALN